MRDKITFCIAILILVLSLGACGNSASDNQEGDSDQAQAFEEDFSGVWETKGGLLLKLNPVENVYTMRTTFHRIGCGSYTYVDGSWRIGFDGQYFKIEKVNDNKIETVALEGAGGSLANAVFNRTDTDTVSDFTEDELQGDWQNSAGTIVSFDMNSKKCICYQLVYDGSDEEDASDPDIYYRYANIQVENDFDGKGNYILINGEKVYITINNNQKIGFYLPGNADKEEKEIFDGSFKRISYVTESDLNVTSFKEKYTTEAKKKSTSAAKKSKSAKNNAKDSKASGKTDGSSEDSNSGNTTEAKANTEAKDKTKSDNSAEDDSDSEESTE